MKSYQRIAISFACTKEAALYFDHVIPVFAAAEMLTPKSDSLLTPWPGSFGDSLIPETIRKQPGFNEMLVDVNQASCNLMLKRIIQQFGFPPHIGGVSDEDYPKLEEHAADKYYHLIEEFQLSDLPVVAPASAVCDAALDSGDVAVALSSLPLVDVSQASWQQIAELREDETAKEKLRRLRLFAAETYAGKSRSYIEDDLYRRIADYEEETRRWGLETTHAVLTMLLTSKSLAGALSGSLVSSLFGAPAAAVASAVGGAVVEIAKITVEVSRRKFALRNALRDNPVSYIVDARDEFSQKA